MPKTMFSVDVRPARDRSRRHGGAAAAAAQLRILPVFCMFCFVLFALQLSVCLWWHDHRRDDFPTLNFGVVMAYCRWDRQPRHTIECCLHKPGCCVCGQAHKGRDCDRLPVGMKAAQQSLKRACQVRALRRPMQIGRCTLRWRSRSGGSMPRHGARPARPCTRRSPYRLRRNQHADRPPETSKAF